MTGVALDLPAADGTTAPYVLTGTPVTAEAAAPARARVAFAAVHVVADPLRTAADAEAELEWEATLAIRRRLWDLGLGVAEVMDTAQRGMGLDWPTARRLIDATLAEAPDGSRVACGAVTDQLAADQSHELERIRDAYLEQIDHIEDRGGQAVIMASPALAATARTADDYLTVYDAVLKHVRRPVILHWLGPAFDPRLTGYWGTTDLSAGAGTLLGLVAAHADRVEGVKISTLDRRLEEHVRAAISPVVRVFTGDDFNYLDLIEGDGHHHSDALLGIFGVIAPVAAQALRALDDGDARRYRDLLAPTVPLSCHLFADPTRYYKTGVTFLAWLNGHQRHFRMLGGLEGARSVLHLSEAFVLADRAGVLADPPLAAARMRALLALAGVS